MRILSLLNTGTDAGFAPLRQRWDAMLLQQLGQHRKALVLSCDAIMALLSCSVASVLRLGTGAFSPGYADTLLTSTVVFTVIALPIFYAFRLHRQVWRYASMADLVMIVKAVTLAILIFTLAMFVFTRLNDLPRSLPIIQWSVLIILLGGPRLADRWLRACLAGWRHARSRARSIPVLVLGTSDEAQIFLRAIATGYAPLYRAVGILNVNGDLTGRLIHGVPVLGSIEDLSAVLVRLTKAHRRPHRLIVTDAMERLPNPTKLALFERASECGLTLARLPRLTEFRSFASAPEVRPIALEDLLGRPQITLDRNGMRQMIADRQVLITGAGGSIGSELTRQIAALDPARLVLIEQNEYNLYRIAQELEEAYPHLGVVPLLCDVRNPRRLDHIFAKYKPEVVFHAAACKHVPLIESNPLEGVAANTLGTRNVADAARAHRVTAMVLISTDKAVNPTSIMGASKRLAEYYCQSLDLMASGPHQRSTRFITVRFGNVLGSSGSVVPLFQRQLANGGPLTVTHPEIQRYFMTIPEAVELILQASTHALAEPDVRGRIFVLDMGAPIKIVEVAEQVIRLAGLRPNVDVKIEFTGLRPGEKLFEELFDASETPVETLVPGVLAAQPQAIELGRLGATLSRLDDAVDHHQVGAVEAIFNELIPGFRMSERIVA